MKYLIRSLERHDEGKGLSFFVAIHGYSPFFSTQEKARRFTSESNARTYALKELFTQEAGVFDIVSIP